MDMHEDDRYQQGKTMEITRGPLRGMVGKLDNVRGAGSHPSADDWHTICSLELCPFEVYVICIPSVLELTDREYHPLEIDSAYVPRDLVIGGDVIFAQNIFPGITGKYKSNDPWYNLDRVNIGPDLSVACSGASMIIPLGGSAPRRCEGIDTTSPSFRRQRDRQILEQEYMHKYFGQPPTPPKPLPVFGSGEEQYPPEI